MLESLINWLQTANLMPSRPAQEAIISQTSASEVKISFKWEDPELKELQLYILPENLVAPPTKDEHVDKGLEEENILLIKPIIEYLKRGNPPDSRIQSFLQEHDAIVKTLEITTKNQKFELNIVQIFSLLEACQEKSYDEFIKSIIFLDLIYQAYRALQGEKKNYLVNEKLRGGTINLVKSLEQILGLNASFKEKDSILYEILHVLLFNIRIFHEKLVVVDHMTMESVSSDFRKETQSCFHQAIKSYGSHFFKASWADTLRQEALIIYASLIKGFPRIPRKTSFVDQFKEIVMAIQTQNIGTFVQEDEIRRLKKTYALILSWLAKVQLIPQAPTAAVLVQSEAHPKNKKPNKRPPVVQMSENNIDECANKSIEKEKDEAQNMQQRLVRHAERDQKKSIGWLNKTRTQTIQAELQSKKTLRTLDPRLEKTFKNKETMMPKTLEEETNQNSEQDTIIMALIKENKEALLSKEHSVSERTLRSLRDFTLDNFEPYELPPDNLNTLKNLYVLMAKNEILDIYGSYVVFLASIRLGVCLDKIRPPNDLDLRITTPKENIYGLVHKLFLIGFVPKDQSSFFEKMDRRGYLNLVYPKKDKRSYTIELTVQCTEHYYLPNTDPFNLLKHYIRIQDNRAFFDKEDLDLKKLLAEDILNKRFTVNIHEVLNLRLNVFDFFDRAFRHRRSWGSFLNVQDITTLLNDMQFVKSFFDVRFKESQDPNTHKKCYLEMVNLIVSGYFFLPKAAVIIKGFLRSFFDFQKVDRNVEMMRHELQNNIPKIAKDMRQEVDLKERIYKMFYEQLQLMLNENFIVSQDAPCDLNDDNLQRDKTTALRDKCEQTDLSRLSDAKIKEILEKEQREVNALKEPIMYFNVHVLSDPKTAKKILTYEQKIACLNKELAKRQEQTTRLEQVISSLNEQLARNVENMIAEPCPLSQLPFSTEDSQKKKPKRRRKKACLGC